MTLKLSQDQQAAYDAMVAFICDPAKTAFVLEGFAGTGKSTLMNHFMDNLPLLSKTFALINPTYRVPEQQLTATTHKAVENLSDITGAKVQTIHSFLGLRLQADPGTYKLHLVPRGNFVLPENMVVLIDEASFLDRELLGYVFSRTKNCKIIFIGDPAQLAPVGYTTAPVFEQGFETVRLTKVWRNGGLILDLATKFRETVLTGEWFSFKPDGTEVLHLDRPSFNSMLAGEFTNPTWKHKDSRFLAWSNDRVIEYNNYIKTLVKGDPSFVPGDYAVVNEYTKVGQQSLRNNQVVHITEVTPTVKCGLDCDAVVINGIFTYRAHDRKAYTKALAFAIDEGDYTTIDFLQKWVDLRAVYGETVNKSQGSTYGKVFIDLDDISRCTIGNTMARMLYVATSRAKSQVILTGDIS